MRRFFFGLLRQWSIRLVLIGAFFVLLGADLNHLVVRANGNMMPVATMWGDILFIIGPEEHIGDFEPSDIDTTDNIHRSMTSADKLSFLSDRILIIPSEANALLEQICTKIRLTKLCPFSTSSRMASIGDLMIWAGLPFLLLSLIVVLTGVMRRLLHFCINKTTRT